MALIPAPGGQAGNGGTLPTSPHADAGGGDWTGWKDPTFAPTFTNLLPTAIRDDATDPLAAFDTAVIYQVCNIGTYLANQTFHDRLVNFVAGGGKLIIWDSECQSTDYSQFIYPFTTSNPGAAGAQGTLTITEDSSLGSKDTTSPYYLNAPLIASDTDAVGDANVFTTYDGNWCTAKRATNTLGVNGPVNTYATYGNGLVLYLGLDADYLNDGMKIDNPSSGGYTEAAQNLGYLWELMLRQPWNPVTGLPCSQSASGITLSPSTATNPVGTGHTVTATVVDQNQQPIQGVAVTFRILSGPHSPMSSVGTTGADGKATFTYTGTNTGLDRIQAEAAFTAEQPPPQGVQPPLRTSNVVTKEWVAATPGGGAGSAEGQGTTYCRVPGSARGSRCWGFTFRVDDGGNGPSGSAQVKAPRCWFISKKVTQVEVSGNVADFTANGKWCGRKGRRLVAHVVDGTPDQVRFKVYRKSRLLAKTDKAVKPPGYVTVTPAGSAS